MKFKQIYHFYNGSCVLSAFNSAFKWQLNKIINKLSKYYTDNCNDFTNEYVWGQFLLHNKFELITIPAQINKTRKTIKELATEIPNKLIFAKCAQHIVCIKNGTVYDTSKEILDWCVFHYYIKN